jgi:hypothetical protein
MARGEESAHTWRIRLAHVVDPDCERDGKVLLEGNGCEQRMLVLQAAVLGQDKPESARSEL